jgi:transposase-like protein
MNAAMLIECENHSGAPYQRGIQRNGHANGFKPRTFQTAIGALQLAVPQVRSSDTPFRTLLLEKGSRSDRALKFAIATINVVGIRRDEGKRMILGVSCVLSEAEVHWREFLVSLKERGIGIPDLIVSNAHTGLKAALRAAYNASQWQRCLYYHCVTKHAGQVEPRQERQ